MKFDEIGEWSEIKLEIIQKYASAYSTILAKRKEQIPQFQHVYIDGFCGAGQHISKRSGGMVKGSPLNALAIQPPFDEYYLIDMNGKKVEYLNQAIGPRPDVHLYQGDCSEILLRNVFPCVRYEDYRRGLCLLDPYGLHLKWDVIAKAGLSGVIEIFLNFPVMDMNRTALWNNPEKVAPDQATRMTGFWGDESWRQAAYQQVPTLFGPINKKIPGNFPIVEAFRERLKTQAGFKYVPEPVPMLNSKEAVIYYLFFASSNPTANKIIEGIFDSYRGGPPPKQLQLFD